MRRFVSCLFVVLSLLLIPCGPENSSAAVQKDQPTAAEKGRQQRDEYVKKVNDQIDQLDKKIGQLKVQAEKLGREQKKELDKNIADLEEKRRIAAQKLDKLKSASAGAWEDIKKGTQAALDDLQRTYERVANRLK